jgi:hypothetical protein
VLTEKVSQNYKVYDIKVGGLEILLQAVDPMSLDFLVLTSFMATVSGSPGKHLQPEFIDHFTQVHP